MSEGPPFSRVAILGTGLIGASFGLACQSVHPKISIVAFDKADVLRRVAENGWGWETTADLGEAVRDADLVYLALRVGTAAELLPEIAAECEPGALVTDSGSTKSMICKMAASHFRGEARFLGGHPIAGRELSGLDSSSAELFRGAKYVVIGNDRDADRENDGRVEKFLILLRGIGAEPVWCDAETHDWAVGVVSQMPQLAAIALARVVADESDETGLPVSLAGRGLRDILRVAGSPYDIWRDICLTNSENIARSLDRLSQAIEFLRTRLASRELEAEFRVANELYKSLHIPPRELQ